MIPKHLVILATLGVCGSVMGQSFNVDVGVASDPPKSTYAGAGQAGHWNNVSGAHITPFTPNATPSDDMLLDLEGNATGVGFHQYGGMDLQSVESSDATDTDDAKLMNDYLVTHSIPLESCLYLNGLENGLYEVITYAWFPNQPATMQLVRFDFVPGTTLVGGTWSGGHAEGVTYSYDLIDVTSGHIGWHVGIPAGGDTVIGAAFNGFQLHKVGPPADTDDDGDVDSKDFAQFSDCITGPQTASEQPGCLESDIDDDDDIDLADMAQFQRLFTGS